MVSEARMIGYELLKTGTLVSFRIVEQELLSAPDEAEFGRRLQLKFANVTPVRVSFCRDAAHQEGKRSGWSWSRKSSQGRHRTSSRIMRSLPR